MYMVDGVEKLRKSGRPIMHHRLDCQERHFCVLKQPYFLTCNCSNKLWDLKSQVHAVPGPGRWHKHTHSRISRLIYWLDNCNTCLGQLKMYMVHSLDKLRKSGPTFGTLHWFMSILGRPLRHPSPLKIQLSKYRVYIT